ncbi:hypothetical protein BC332_28723 [Capsicum chinense]|nr:hypothetical protein BC332_28723 [Capsicum chinense]
MLCLEQRRKVRRRRRHRQQQQRLLGAKKIPSEQGTPVSTYPSLWKRLLHLEEDFQEPRSWWKAPTKMRNSPIKLLVPGELILDKVEEKKMIEKFRMVITEPP